MKKVEMSIFFGCLLLLIFHHLYHRSGLIKLDYKIQEIEKINQQLERKKEQTYHQLMQLKSDAQAHKAAKKMGMVPISLACVHHIEVSS
jgi:cell division protein FtsL